MTAPTSGTSTAEHVVLPVAMGDGEPQPYRIQLSDLPADVAERALRVHAEFTWSVVDGKPLRTGEVFIVGTDLSRRQRRQVTREIGRWPHVPGQEAGHDDVLAAWETWIARYRAVTASMREQETSRAMAEPMVDTSQFEAEMARWAATHGSDRLRLGVRLGYRMHALYRHERGRDELPSLFIDSGARVRWHFPVGAPTEEAIAAEQAIRAWLAERAHPYETRIVEVTAAPQDVFVGHFDDEIEYDHEPRDISSHGLVEAVMVQSWLGRFNAFGFVHSEKWPIYEGEDDLECVIDERYPPADAVPDRWTLTEDEGRTIDQGPERAWPTPDPASTWRIPAITATTMIVTADQPDGTSIDFAHSVLADGSDPFQLSDDPDTDGWTVRWGPTEGPDSNRVEENLWAPVARTFPLWVRELVAATIRAQAMRLAEQAHHLTSDPHDLLGHEQAQVKLTRSIIARRALSDCAAADLMPTADAALDAEARQTLDALVDAAEHFDMTRDPRSPA